jgi:hypothetical protein
MYYSNSSIESKTSKEKLFTHFLGSLHFSLHLLLHRLAKPSDVFCVRQPRVGRNKLSQKFWVLPTRSDVVDRVTLWTKNALHGFATVRIDLCWSLKSYDASQISETLAITQYCQQMNFETTKYSLKC